VLVHPGRARMAFRPARRRRLRAWPRGGAARDGRGLHHQTQHRARAGCGQSTGGEMSWEAIASFASVMVTFVGINLAALRTMFERHQQIVRRDDERWSQLERAIYELRVLLPIEYVRREDWIRFSATLDAKMDGLRDEMREEIGPLKEKLYA